MQSERGSMTTSGDALGLQLCTYPNEMQVAGYDARKSCDGFMPFMPWSERKSSRQTSIVLSPLGHSDH